MPLHHGIDVCRCGAIVAQCRCLGPHTTRIVCQSCEACRGRTAGRPTLTSERARAILREYPDADLSAFDVAGDVEAMAAEEGRRSVDALLARAQGVCPRCGHVHAGPSLGGICIGCPCEERG